MTPTPLPSGFQSTAQRPNAQECFRRFDGHYVCEMLTSALALVRNCLPTIT
ncbi:MAG: hypothetical protein HC862_22685 [Scytonema sp. RU_4_4]|nr:hypothetical protein [Scytonema sp. RU_4_4]NJR75660.1 hypothetical protein [Scytonema sp. CRU_2_7]